MDPIKAFECHTPLGYRDKYESLYIDISNYKRIKFAIYSDACLVIRFYSSYDGISQGPVYSLDYNQKKVWKDYVHPCNLDYLKVVVEKTIPNSDNEEIHIIPKGILLRGAKDKLNTSKKVSFEKVEKQIDLYSSDEESSKTPPKRSFVSKVLSSPSKSTIEMPSLCLPNQLFIGGKNKVCTIPPPDKQGQVLTFDGNSIKWI